MRASRDATRAEAFEETDVEDRMDLHGRRELESKSRPADLFRDGERAEALVVELVAGSGCLDVTSEEPHLVAFLEPRGFPDLAVVEIGLGCRGISKVRGKVLVDVTEGLGQSFDRWVGRLAGVDGGWKRGMVAVVGDERCLAGRCVGGVVICEFREREQLLPIVLLVVAEYPQILLQDLVDSFRLAVTLWVEGCRQVGLDVHAGQELSPKPGGEDFVAIRHDVGRETMEATDVPEEESSDLRGCGCGFGGHEVRHLGETIHRD